MMEALSSSETSVLTRATRRNVTEDAILHSQRHENLKSYIDQISWLSKTDSNPRSVERGSRLHVIRAIIAEMFTEMLAYWSCHLEIAVAMVMNCWHAVCDGCEDAPSVRCSDVWSTPSSFVYNAVVQLHVARFFWNWNSVSSFRTACEVYHSFSRVTEVSRYAYNAVVSNSFDSETCSFRKFACNQWNIWKHLRDCSGTVLTYFLCCGKPNNINPMQAPCCLCFCVSPFPTVEYLN
jgi:hypothetical protein